MAKAKVEIQKKEKSVDLFLEVRDCRAPICTSFDHDSEKKRLIVLNKADLVDRSTANAHRIAIQRREDSPCVLLDARDASASRTLMKEVIKYAVPRFKTLGLRMSVVGVPNGGKSTLIRSLQSLQSVSLLSTQRPDIGATPGVTRLLRSFKVSDDPLVYCDDTPGITGPKNRSDPRTSYILAALGVIPDSSFDKRVVCDYLLWRLNVAGQFSYVSVNELKEPVDSIDDLVASLIASPNLASSRSVRRLSELDVLSMFLKQFRTGQLGRICLDPVPVFSSQLLSEPPDSQRFI